MPIDLPPWLAHPQIQTIALIIGSVIAGYAAEFVIRVLLMALARKTATDLDDRIIATLRAPIITSVVLCGLYLASMRLNLPKGAEFFILASLETLAIIIWSTATLTVGHTLLEATTSHAASGSIVQRRTLPIFHMSLKVAVAAGGVYLIFLVWSIDLTAWLASAGILGIAVGFAAKDSLANLFSGVFIVADGPYKVGDFIVLDGELRGEVSHIGMRSTRILTRDDVEITVPNAVIGGSKIVNESGGPYVKQRIRVAVEAAYGSDVDLVREVLLSCPEGVDDVCETPEPQVRFRKFGGSGLLFELMVWIDQPALRGRIIDKLNTRVYKRFAEANIEIPYSKHDVYIKQMPTS